MTSSFIKRSRAAPKGFFAVEANGLAWLAEPRVVPVVRVLNTAEDSLTLERLHPSSPTETSAREFGAQLAKLHNTGAPSFGWTPGDASWFGPLSAPFEVPTTTHSCFTGFWVERLEFITRQAKPGLSGAGARSVERAIDAIRAGVFDGVAGQHPESPSRVHGDLWSGNIMWTANGATLIDPAAHGGHRLEDLAMLTLFGAPHLERIFQGYEAEHPMPESWREDLPVHLFFGLLAHVYLFGAGYAQQAHAVADQIISRTRSLNQ